MPSVDEPARAAPVRAAWVRPEVECLETRPEITAYAGTATTWTNSR